MLQQTQVSRVEQFYPRFLARYPTIGDLARARPNAVRESWDGLGYYRRAANLHRLAQEVVKRHGGELPQDTAQLRALPGVGAYTAGAVAAFAYERREPAVDTNVARVLTRVFFGGAVRAHGRAPLPPRPIPPAKLWSLARSLLPTRGKIVWEFNQALMDLGATICTARVARCGECPVRPVCKTGGKGAR
jgi:A/G-specific adenine glycosylase